ncbi:MAG: hypothetical protein EZS28_046253, partial [Streblomastix strix]
WVNGDGHFGRDKRFPICVAELVLFDAKFSVDGDSHLTWTNDSNQRGKITVQRCGYLTKFVCHLIF